MTRIEPPARVKIVVEASPSDGRINRRFEMNWSPRRPNLKPTLRKSVRYRAFVDAIAWAVRRTIPATTRYCTGQLGVSCTFYWPTQDHVTLGRNAGFPRGDVDSPIKATLDGLQASGLIDSDARVVEIYASKRHDKQHPRVVIEVYVVPDCD